MPIQPQPVPRPVRKEERVFSSPDISIVIPTYNRRDSLLRTLASVSRQVYPAQHLEVIVVDDGSSDGTEEATTRQSYPFRFSYIRQANQGATKARNDGAERSQGRYLLFIDDDIELAENTLRTIATELASREETIVLGSLYVPVPAQWSMENVANREPECIKQSSAEQKLGEFVPFQMCLTGLLGVQRQDFERLGMFCDPTGGWPNWDDVDFGYRAHQAGFRFWRSNIAVAYHWDYSSLDVRTSSERWYRASLAAPRLFQVHPDLRRYLTMFHYKAPVNWREDPPLLVLRKIVRQFFWSPASMWFMEQMASLLQRHTQASVAAEFLNRLIISGYIYRGYRDGLREIGVSETPRA